MDDPYKILSIPKNCTDQQLKDAYKKLIIVLHPDKPTGNIQLFKIVTDAFRKVAKDIKERSSDKQFFELKDTYRQQSTNKPTMQNMDLDFSNDKNFNVDKFNQVYEANRLETATDIGYNDFLRNDKIKKEKQFKKNFTIDRFNAHFDKVSKFDETSKHLIKYKEPEPLQLAKQIQYTELGLDNIDDFSSDNLSRKNLNYMDLKIAHTTNRIVDPTTVSSRRDYKTIEQLEDDRANINYEMTHEDLQEYHRRKKIEEQREKSRIQTQIRLDQLSQEQFNKVHKLLLGRNA
jgi:curved DNA-binding protein CbpA